MNSTHSHMSRQKKYIWISLLILVLVILWGTLAG